MLFNAIMHVSFYTDRMDEMIDFYQNKLEATPKVVVRYKIYLDRDDRPAFQAIAREDPERVFYMYFELAPGQFVELFPKNEGMVDDDMPWNSRLGYSHFALTVDDIYAVREKMEAAGVEFDTAISKGPSETYQMWAHDPDGNMFEIMQYTENSYQLVGHFD